MDWFAAKALADSIPSDDAAVLDACIDYFEMETREIGEGRHRARIARRLKHSKLSDKQRNRVVRIISRRLISGQFAEQFKDQLRLAIQLEPDTIRQTAEQAQASSKIYVSESARWVLDHPGIKIA